MFEVFNTWQFNLILLYIASIFFNQFYYLAAQNVKKNGTTTVILQLIASGTLLFLVPFFAFKFPSDYSVYLFLFLAIIFYTITDRLQTSVRRYLQVSVISILFQIVRIFLIVYGVLIFKEPIVFSKMAGAGLIMLGCFLILYKKGQFKINKYVIYSFLSSFFLATAIIIDVDISGQFNIPFYLFFAFFIPALLIAIFERVSIRDIVSDFNSSRKKYYLITGIAWGLVYYFMIRSLQLGEITVVAPLQAVAVLFNVIVAYYFLKERDNIFKKIIAAFIVILGIYLTIL